MGQVGHDMVRLTKEQLGKKLKFIENYINASNAADGSTFDPNSNVSNKNIATLLAELNKDINIQIERGLVTKKIAEMFGQDIADMYIEQLEKHEIYCHDETAPMPYCVAISMYPFLENGLKAFGGETQAPKHLSSFDGGFTNLIFAISSQFCGAVATVEFLMCFDHYAKIDYGDNYLETHEREIKQELQQVVYCLNQPASARNFQSVFWNISIFDKYYFEALFGNFYFPDGSKSDWESLNKLQKYFMKWFNQERKKALLTFPVVTVSLLNDGKHVKDAEYEEFVANELSEGNSFFIYTSDTVDSLSSCCFHGDERINVVRSNGIKWNVSIKEYVESIGKDLGPYFEVEKSTGDLILSYDPDTDSFEEVEITGVLKKKNNEKLVAVKVGREWLRVTQDHMFIVQSKEDLDIVEMTAKELTECYDTYKILVLNEESIPVYRDIIQAHVVTNNATDPVYDIQLAENHYFFANNILTHNCRLRNSIADQLNDFSYSLGAGGVMTGSMNVLTLNMNRFVQDCRKAEPTMDFEQFNTYLNTMLKSQIKLMHKYQIGFKLLFQDMQKNGMLPVYDAHYIELDKQYLTIGINGLLEGMEFLGIPVTSDLYKSTVKQLLKTVSDTNKETVKEYPELKLKFNTEMVPSL